MYDYKYVNDTQLNREEEEVVERKQVQFWTCKNSTESPVPGPCQRTSPPPSVELQLTAHVEILNTIIISPPPPPSALELPEMETRSLQSFCVLM